MTKTVLSKLGGHPLRQPKVRKNVNHLSRQLRKLVVVVWVLSGLIGISARAAELKPETVAAFDRYIGATEARMGNDLSLNQFLIVDRLPDLQRKEAYEQLQKGQIYIEELNTQADHHPIPIPNALIHHWVGVAFIPKATLSETIALLHDYDDEPAIYKPEVRRAKVLERNGFESKIYLQLFNKSIVTVVLNAYFDVMEMPSGNTRSQSASRSTRIVEVVDAGGPNEHERTDGNDHGYIWRLYNYWRIEEKDGGVYVQNESITLSRTVPALLAWLVNPLIKRIPRDVLIHLLTDTRNGVTRAGTVSKQENLR
jgi:hypothetical protein